MEDVQGGAASVPLPIDRVGVKDLRLPLKVKEKGGGVQHSVAVVDLSVDLPAEFKGTHMSRFVECVEHWSGELDYSSFKALLKDIAAKLTAERAYARFTFPYFLRQESPVSRSRGIMGHSCTVEGIWDGSGLDFILSVLVPVMTVCPCSLAISDQGAHSQRAEVRIAAKFTGFLWMEDLIEIAEASGSSPVYTLLKREDEKFVTEAAFDNPAFVEDVVRAAARGLADHPQITWFSVQVESYESIHSHSAFASIERSVEPGREKG